MKEETFLVLAQYRQNSTWADEIGVRYHFPKKYFNLLSKPNIRFLYFEPKKFGRGEFFGHAKVGRVTSSNNEMGGYFAELFDYVPFVFPVSEFDASGSRWERPPYFNPQNAVRRIDPEVYRNLCSAGINP